MGLQGGSAGQALEVQHSWDGWRAVWLWLAGTFKVFVCESIRCNSVQKFWGSWELKGLNLFSHLVEKMSRYDCPRIFWSSSSQREGTGVPKQYSSSVLVIQRHSPGNCSNFNALCCHPKLDGYLTVVLVWWAGTGVVAAVDETRTDGGRVKVKDVNKLLLPSLLPYCLLGCAQHCCWVDD